MRIIALILLFGLTLSCSGHNAGVILSAAVEHIAYRTVYVVNRSRLTDEEVQRGVPAVQRQLSGEFKTAWAVDTTLVFADPPDIKAQTIYLVDAIPHGPNAGLADAGWHDSLFIGWVGASEQWTRWLSHEAIEMMGFGEICDPVSQPYGVPPVENFELPSGVGYLESKT